MKSTLNNVKKSKMGRPKIDSEAITVRMTRADINKVDDYRRLLDGLPSRPEAIRRLIRLGLENISK